MVPNRQMPVIVLMDKETSGEQAMIRQWFEDSRFATCEASNVFDALEDLSDFTIGSRPDVILLDVDNCEDQLLFVSEVSNLPVMALSGKTVDKKNHSSFRQVVSRLNELMPQ